MSGRSREFEMQVIRTKTVDVANAQSSKYYWAIKIQVLEASARLIPNSVSLTKWTQAEEGNPSG
jgi:hypothetical protein